MSEEKFKVGQVWKTRDGRLVTLAKIKKDLSYPLEGTIGNREQVWAKDGKYFDDRFNDRLDLIELVEK